MTIKDIARESGYAVGTVSRVLNDHPNVSDTAREAIMRVVEKYNFRLNSNAKHLKQHVSREITIIVKGFRNMLFADILERMQVQVKQKGYACQIYYIGEWENEVKQAIQIIREQHPQGVVFLGSSREFFQESFAEISIPCILITNSAEGMGFANLSSVGTDDAKAAETAMDYLLSLGHTRIGILGGRMEHSQAASGRYLGCGRAFDAHGVSFSFEQQYESAYFTVSGGYQAMEQLIGRMPDLTAVFAMADVMAVGAIRALNDRGFSVPDDISVVGFDGISVGEFHTPRITTIRQEWEQIADRGVEILFSCINGGEAVHEVVSYRFLERESAKRLNGVIFSDAPADIVINNK